MNDFNDSLDRIKSICSEIVLQFSSSDVTESIKVLNEALDKVSKSWCGSWLGYQSRIYYAQLSPVPPGARFSQEWGFSSRFSHHNVGNWQEYEFDQVYNFLKSRISVTSFKTLETLSNNTKEKIPEICEELISIIDSCTSDRVDEYLARQKDEIEKHEPLTIEDFINVYKPSGSFISRDMIALQSGRQTPPHIYFQAQLMAIQVPSLHADSLQKIANRISVHLSNKSRVSMQSHKLSNHIFIGHGRSHLWRELKDFVSERLGLPWDEFNRVPTAGLTNITRLSEMLDSASFAFLVMTAEDEQNNGKLQARMNVIHEAGLFQGRIGFTRAIVLLEEGCEEFSNIQGLGQIRFPRGNIKACFEDIRMVLEREGLV